MVRARVIFIAVLLLPLPACADPVTEWTALADQLGRGGANWHTLAIMHQAMHDAWNAALPSYARWSAPAPDEPPGTGALPQVAMAAAARRVLLSLHPDATGDVELLFRAALARASAGSPEQAGVALGDAIGAEAVRRRADDGFDRRHPFAKQSGPGAWQPVPPEFDTSNTTETRPFLFASAADVQAEPPPPPGSDADRRGIIEALRTGGADTSARTPAQTEAAMFWAYQSSQRGFVALGAALLDARPRPGGLAAHARIMAQLTAAMADSAVLVWSEKERFYHWRPIAAIRQTQPDGARWEPLIQTPAHPEYPSGHAADCFTGAAVLKAAFPDLRGPIVYRVPAGRPAGRGHDRHGPACPGHRTRPRDGTPFSEFRRGCRGMREFARLGRRAFPGRRDRVAPDCGRDRPPRRCRGAPAALGRDPLAIPLHLIDHVTRPCV